MSAHRPRKVFAKSFVVTVAALPLAAACAHEEPVHANPPAGVLPDATASATPTNTAPDPATSNATTASSRAGAASSMTWTIVRDSSGKCRAMVDMTCPQGVSCNPPPPSAYTCPAEVPTDSYPLNVTAVAGSSMCETKIYEPSSSTGSCPPGAHCNPPPPQSHTVSVPCPK